MSGQLVGEVIDAAPALKAQGLSERGYHALVAIAEKCNTRTRQGSVRWNHIRANLYGASLSTAKRAVADLKSAGVIRVVKRGFDNHSGRVCAPIYGIEPLGERVTQVTQSPTERTGQIGGRTGQIGGRTGHSGDPLDGSIDGSIDGGCASAASPAIPEEPPPKTCTQHPDWNGPPCVRCQSDKHAYRTWLDDSRRLLSDLDREADTTRSNEADEIRNERRHRIAVFQRLRENWK